MKSKILTGAVAGLAACTVAASASAAPVTVDLRVEGKSRTLVEQKVTVDVRRFKFSDSSTDYKCDGTGSNGEAAAPSPTSGAALAEAAERGGFELTGSFNQQFESPTFSRINGDDVAYDPATYDYLGEYKNGTAPSVGSCGVPVTNGDEVLFAYGAYGAPLLHLTGPATVKPGESATLTVTDESNGGTAPVSGAGVAGGTSSSDGRVTTAAFTQRGPQTFKATKSGAIRSNTVTVCVTDGADGFCGTSVPGAADTSPPAAETPTVPDRVAAFAKLTSITEGKRFARGRGPRILAGQVDAEPAGLKDVRLRLSRTSGSGCSYYDGARERLVRTRRCGVTHARTFTTGSDAAFSYLLPGALPAGRYVLDAVVLDRSGNQTTTYQRGRNRVVFFVG